MLCLLELELEELEAFDPRIESQREIDTNHLSQFFRKVQEINRDAVLFKSIETLSTTVMTDFSNTIVHNVKERVLAKKLNTEQEATQLLLNELRLNDKIIKINSVVRATGAIKPKTTPLVAKTILFYAKEISNHVDLKVQKCGLFLLKESYIAASPDGIATCKCHGTALIEIKCPYTIRNKTITEGAKECQFLATTDDAIKLSKTHKYYTQIISQMAIANIDKCYFIVWTNKDLFMEIVTFDEKHWKNVKTNLEIFYKSFVCPALLEFKPLTYCGSCDNVLLEECEINENEERELISIQCDFCAAWFHYKCENITSETDTNEWLCSKCLLSLVDA